MSYNKKYTEEELKAFQLKDYVMQTQTITNCAVQVAIHNAKDGKVTEEIFNEAYLIVGKRFHESIIKKKVDLGL